MKPQFEEIYQDLQANLRQCYESHLTEIEKAETCYRIALDHWLKLKERFMARIIYVDSEEIEFFKAVKPSFTRHIEYNLILNQGLLFIPAAQEEKINYWKEEAKRYKRFCKINADFIAYYESMDIRNDMNYFLQRKCQQKALAQERIYLDSDCRSSHDHIVRGLLANKMYHEFVSKQIHALEPDLPVASPDSQFKAAFHKNQS